MILSKPTLIALIASLLLLATLSSAHAQKAEPWSTYRGNAQRSGCADDLPGPASPKVLWAMKTKDHYIASPLPVGNRLVVSGLGAFNTANFACLNTDAKPANRVLWSKGTPFLKLPTVSSPGVMGNRLVFGDGMHQTDGATLYCLDAEQGAPLWRHGVPGTLVHLEGSPTLLAGRAYIGGGAAGVVCVEADKTVIDGKTVDLDTAGRIMADGWKKLLVKYEDEKKKDPTFALPPTEENLPKSEPKRLWQQGRDKWHVDAPVAVVGDKVLVASAFLDKEQVGDRAILCLNATTGVVLWRTPLKLNPWGGPSVLGDLVVVSGSSIGYDPKVLKGAKGFVAAFNLKDGKEVWSKDITGGVVACAALAGSSAIVSATDGKVRAFDLATGERQWIYDAKSPLFAPVAVAKGTVYAGDLNGVIHAIDGKSGTGSWTLDLGAHPDVQAPGMVYGGPVVQNGRLFVATCNLEGIHARKETVVVCIGDK